MSLQGGGGGLKLIFQRDYKIFIPQEESSTVRLCASKKPNTLRAGVGDLSLSSHAETTTPCNWQKKSTAVFKPWATGNNPGPGLRFCNGLGYSLQMMTLALIKQNPWESKCKGLRYCKYIRITASPPRQAGENQSCYALALFSRIFYRPWAISGALQGRFCTPDCCAGAQLECSRYSPLSLGSSTAEASLSATLHKTNNTSTETREISTRTFARCSLNEPVKQQ